MASLQRIEATILYETLVSLPAVQAAVPLEGSPGYYKVFWKYVHESISMPYIIMDHMAGGYDNDTLSQASDSIWKIVGVTVNLETTREALADAIAGLHRKMPISTTYPNSCGYAWITEESAVHEVKSVENNPILYVGGFYRLRLSHY